MTARLGFPGVMLVLAATVLLAQEPSSVPSGTRQAAEEPLTSWQWFQDVNVPAGKGRHVDFILPPSVFDKARADLGDLRLVDGNGTPVPYALRVRRTINQQQSLPANEFNHGKRDDRADELSLDLGTAPVTHNEIEIVTSGSNFRRRVRLEGGDTDKDWKVIETRSYLVHYQVDSQVVDVRRVHYPASRFRYVRVRVLPDSGDPNDAPEVTSAVVYQATQVAGEYATAPAQLGPREPVRADAVPGSAWIIDLGGEQVPCEQLSFKVEDDGFVRDYRLEALNDEVRTDRPPDAPYRPENMDRYADGVPPGWGGYLAGGQWQRRAGAEHKSMEIRFNEVAAHRLRLVVTDNRNPPLNITGVEYTAAVRQVIFARPADLVEPLRLYVGNPKARPPEYDFARNLESTLTPPPVRATLEPGTRLNPDYRPEPKPWTERWPWVIYVVLGAASLTLLAILGILARESIRRHDVSEPVENTA